jgi:aspartate/methionine/tyrosine aminotransferase
VSPPTISQYLAKLFLQNDLKVNTWFEDQINEIKKVRYYLINEIKSSRILEIEKESLTGRGGYYLFPKLIDRKFKNAKEFSQKLIQEQNVIVLPGQYFGSGWEKYVRISFGNVSESEAIEGFSRIYKLFS